VSTQHDPPTMNVVETLKSLLGGGRLHGVRLRERNGRAWLSVSSEFAMIELSISVTSTGPRVVISDPETEQSIALDPLELEALTRLSHEDFGPLILDRWPDVDALLDPTLPDDDEKGRQ
jgi:hypothetical protein